MSKTITVFGHDYIGQPTALLFAKTGIIVIGVDINQTVVNSLNNECLPFEDVGNRC
jgi:UDP-N-acetyl-D-mannosaminuronic acid dehydrogenase